MSYYAPSVMCPDLHQRIVYSADDFDKRNMEHGIAFRTKEEAIECAKKMLAAVKQEG